MLDCWLDFDEHEDDNTHYECCQTCHGCNFFDDDVRLDFLLKDGTMAHLCCGKIRKLVANGQLSEKALEKAHG